MHALTPSTSEGEAEGVLLPRLEGLQLSAEAGVHGSPGIHDDEAASTKVATEVVTGVVPGRRLTWRLATMLGSVESHGRGAAAATSRCWEWFADDPSWREGFERWLGRVLWHHLRAQGLADADLEHVWDDLHDLLWGDELCELKERARLHRRGGEVACMQQ